MDYEVKHVLKNYDDYLKIIEELKNKKREIAANQLKTGGSVIKSQIKTLFQKTSKLITSWQKTKSKSELMLITSYFQSQGTLSNQFHQVADV